MICGVCVFMRAVNVLSLLKAELSLAYSTSKNKCIYDIVVIPHYSNLATPAQSIEACLKPIVNFVPLTIES